jgi:predicted site-specific integrase-resolvase
MGDLTLREWAERENVTYSRAYQWFKDGLIKGARGNGDRIFLPASVTAPEPGKPPAKVCADCGAIVEYHRDNHWPWCREASEVESPAPATGGADG